MTKIGIPLYVWPGVEWDWKVVNTLRAYVGGLVVNPNSGYAPKTPEWHKVIDKLGPTKQYGYTPASKGRLGIFNDMQKYIEEWKINKFFIDEAYFLTLNDIESLDRFKYEKGIPVLYLNYGNVSSVPDDVWHNSTMFVVIENFAANIIKELESLSAEKLKKIWVLAHTATRDQCELIWSLCRSFSIPKCYVTDVSYDDGPWNELGNMFLENVVF